MKKCKKCNIIKELSQFHNSKNRKDGLYPYCKDCKSIDYKKYREKYREVLLIKKRDYYFKYHELNKKKRSEYTLKRLKVDPIFRLQANLRSRFKVALKRNYKRGSAIRDLGCTISEFKIYIESKFQPGMSWENYGKWHIDHIIPLSKFNLKRRKDLKQALHYTNMQPLWAIDNIKKGNRL